MYLMYFFPILFFIFSCTNYSTSKTKIVAPILISANNNVTDYGIKLRVTNQEPLLAGYNLYIGSTESEARNPADLTSGINCPTPSILPNTPTEFAFAIRTTTSVTAPVVSPLLCTFTTDLAVKGKFISVRTLLLSIQPGSQSRNRLNPSLPSNTLILP